MTVNEIEGAALARVQNPDAVGRLPLRRELEGALREMVQAIREADTDIADNVTAVDLVAGQNTYPQPADTDTIRKVERFDFAGTGTESPVAIPCGLIPIDMLNRARIPAYALGPMGLVLWPTPANDMVAGMRILSLPVAERLPNDNQEPRLPEPLHEVLASKLTRRLGSLANVQLSQGAADWINQQHIFMLGYLNPGGRESVTRFARSKSTYHARRF